MTPAERAGDFPPGTLNRNVRDILAHLHHWHLLLLDWYRAGMAGDQPDMPAKGYTWAMTPALNRAIQAQYCQTPLSAIRKMLEESHAQVMKLISQHSDAELFDKGKYRWTGSTSLGAYLVSATPSHYEWAAKLIRRVTR